MTLEPLHDGLRRLRGDENIEPSSGHPSAGERPKEVGLCAVMGRGRAGPEEEPDAPPARREAETAEDPARLVRVEVDPVEAGHHLDHLLGREPPAADRDEVLIERFGSDVTETAALEKKNS